MPQGVPSQGEQLRQATAEAMGISTLLNNGNMVLGLEMNNMRRVPTRYFLGRGSVFWLRPLTEFPSASIPYIMVSHNLGGAGIGIFFLFLGGDSLFSNLLGAKIGYLK